MTPKQIFWAIIIGIVVFLSLIIFVNGANEPINIDTKTHAVRPPSASTVAPADFDFTGRTVLGIGGGVGTVTSVGLAAPAVLFSVSGSPVTSTGIMTLNLVSVSQNFVFAGPTSGSGTPTFRALTSGDLPAGLGTVTSFSATNLAALFASTTVTNPTTTPALSFTLPVVANHNFFGNNSGLGATPIYTQPAFTDLSGSLAAAQFPALTGDVTTPAGSVATTISANAVTYAKMQAASATSKLIGSSASSTALGEITLGTNLSITGSTINAAGGTTSPGGSNTQIQYNNSGAFGGIGSATFDGTIPITLTLTPASNTYATGLLLTDTTTAPSTGNQQYSPSAIFHGSGWKTTATAGAQPVDMRLTLVPVQGVNSPTSFLEIGGQINNAGYTTLWKFVNDAASSGQLLGPADSGGINNPTYAFIADATMGMYRAAANDLRLAYAGFDVMAINATHQWFIRANTDFGNTEAAPSLRLGYDSTSPVGLDVIAGTIAAGNWGSVRAGLNDSATTTVGNGVIIGHQSTGTPAAGFGSALLFNAKDSTTADVNAGQIASAWSTATHSSNVSYMDFLLDNGSTTLGSKMRLFGSGGLSVNSTTDPGAGTVNANTGFKLANAEFPIAANGIVKRTAANTYAAAVAKTDYWDTTLMVGDSGGAGAAGLVPSPGSVAGTTKFLREDATWAVPAGGAPGGSNTQVQYNNSGAFGGITNLTSDGTNVTAIGLGSAVVETWNADTGLARNAAGVVEVNNATAGTYRDVKLRNANFQGAPFCASITTTTDQTTAGPVTHVTYTIPANSAVVGTTYHYVIWGNFDNGTTQITYTVQSMLAGNQFSNITFTSLTSAQTNKEWRAEGTVTIRTTGVSGTGFGEGTVSVNGATVINTAPIQINNSGATGLTFNSTTAQTLLVQLWMSVVTGSPHIRSLGGYIQQVN